MEDPENLREENFREAEPLMLMLIAKARRVRLRKQRLKFHH